MNKLKYSFKRLRGCSHIEVYVCSDGHSFHSIRALKTLIIKFKILHEFCTYLVHYIMFYQKKKKKC